MFRHFVIRIAASIFRMSLPKEQPDKTDCEIELPQAIIETFARFLVPEIRKYYDSEQGQREFSEWQEAQKSKSYKM